VGCLGVGTPQGETWMRLAWLNGCFVAATRGCRVLVASRITFGSNYRDADSASAVTLLSEGGAASRVYHCGFDFAIADAASTLRAD
jgi:hypothetical protein